MQFEDFPTDFLALLLNGQNSWSAIELYKCGNRSLNTKIVKSVTHIDLKDTEPLSTSRWPRCLKEFKLETLKICRDGGTLGTTEMVRGELKKLSSTLKDIEIHAVDIGMCFFDETAVGHVISGGAPMRFGDERDDDGSDSTDDEYAESGTGDRDDQDQGEHNENGDEEENDDDGEPRPSKRSKTTEVDDQDTPHTSMWNLELTWPHLERLDLKNTDNSRGYPTGCFGSSVFAMLPRSLMWLGFYYAFTYESMVDLSALPPRLQTLHLPVCSINIAGLRTLPKSITDLGHSVEAETVLPLLLKKPSLLPNLKDLPYFWDPDMSGEEWLGDIFEGSRSWSKNKHIRTLRLNNDNEDITFRCLPPNLTELGEQYSDACLTADLLLGLPRQLTTLDIPSINWRDFDVKNWPPTLTKLGINSEEVGVHFFHHLPRTLRVLEIGDWDRDPEDKAARICNDADALCTIGKDSLLLDDANWQVEKQCLLAAGSQAYVAEIEAGALCGLPLTLTHIKLGYMKCPLTHRLLMPPHVREVGVVLAATVDYPTLFDAFKYIDPVALTVDILHSTPFTRPTTDGADLDPPKLTSLFLSNISSLVWRANRAERGVLRYLPRGLRHLSFYGKQQLEEFDHLPPNLESLAIYDSIEGLLPSRLPQTIKALTLNNLTGSDLKDLPPHLESLKVGFIRDAQLSHLLELPRSLRSLSLLDLYHRVAFQPNQQDFVGVLSASDLEALISTYRPFWRIWHTDESQIAKEIALAKEIATDTEIVQGGTSGTNRDDIDPRTARRLRSNSV